MFFRKSDIQTNKKNPAGKLATEVRIGDAPKSYFQPKLMKNQKRSGNQPPVNHRNFSLCLSLHFVFWSASFSCCLLLVWISVWPSKQQYVLQTPLSLSLFQVRPCVALLGNTLMPLPLPFGHNLNVSSCFQIQIHQTPVEGCSQTRTSSSTRESLSSLSGQVSKIWRGTPMF